MTVSLRPHHLLCLLAYVGKGYTAAFTGKLRCHRGAAHGLCTGIAGGGFRGVKVA